MTLEDVIKIFRDKPETLREFKCSLTRTESVGLEMDGGFIRIVKHQKGCTPEVVAILDFDDWKEVK
jgi:hypothetical protein